MAKTKGGKGKSPRKLLANVSASIPPGSVLAVMGPSGAGKTTLLSMLMLDRGGGIPEGIVTLRGHKLTLDLYMKHCAAVPQYDSLWWSMTVAEHILSALAFYQPQLSKSERTASLEKLVEDMGLRSCMHTKVGNVFVKGLSGGQKRRLSLSVALCKKPLVIFLDEPTSGLDSCAAASIMGVLKKVAKTEDVSILCTIHAPSAAVFDGFDQVLFMTGGKPAFIGPGTAVTDYVAFVGESLPANCNPADHFLDLLNKDFSSSEKVERLVTLWHDTQPSVMTPKRPAALPEKEMASLSQQVRGLLHKHGKMVLSDPTLYLARVISYPVTTAFFAIVYIDSRNRRQDQVEPRTRLCMWCVTIPPLLSLIAVYALNQEILAIRREVKDGMYSAVAYVLATSILQAPLLLVLGLGCIFPAVYPIGGIEDWGRFHVAWLMNSANLLCFEQVAQLLSLFRNPLVGMMLFMNVWFMFLLFCGVLVDPKDVIWPFRALDYWSPFRLTVPSLVHAVLIDTPAYSGAELCNSTVFGCLPGGFQCPQGGNACFGVTGEQLLASLHVRYAGVSSKEEWSENIVKLLGFAALVKLLFLGGLMHQLRQIDLPLAPSMRTSSTTNDAAPAPAPDDTSSASTGTECQWAWPRPALNAEEATPGTVDVVVDSQQTELQQGREGSEVQARAKGAKDIRTPRPGGLVSASAGFVFRNCTYTVMAKAPKGERGRKPKKLLDNVSGEVPPGTVLAVMGPSGAGKTTLLSMLMLDDLGGTPEGEVTLGGHDFTLDLYTRHACVVQQTDTLWWPLSPHDHISLAVQLYRAEMSKAEQATLVDDLIKKAGLSSAQHTKAGNIFFKGLSGGQKRRLSLAISLAKRPQVIFLDEPTSGLDAAAAASVMHYLKGLAHAERVSILCTVHQPSNAVFNGFDRVLFLAGGRVAYTGVAEGITGFLSRLGKPAAAEANPADYMLDLINKDFGDVATVESVVGAWAKEGLAIPPPLLCVLAKRQLPGLRLQLRVLLLKNTRLLVLDPISYVVRAGMFVGSTCFLAGIYIETRELDLKQVLPRVALSMWLIGVTTSMGVVVIYLMNKDYEVVKREVKDGMYHPLTHVLAQACLQLPMLALLAIFVVFPAVYGIGNWDIEEFGRAWAICMATLASFEFMAELLSIAFADPLLGMLAYIVCWFGCFLFCGVLVDERSVPWPIRAMCSFSPLRWAFGQMAWAMMLRTPDYDGVEDCTPGADGSFGIATTGPLAGQTVSCPRGFYCPADPSGLTCWGRTGPQIITGLSTAFSAIQSFESGDNMGRDIGIIVGVALAFKLCYLGLFVCKSRKCQVPKKTMAPATKSEIA